MTTALWTPRQQEIARKCDPFAPKPCKIYGFIVRDPWAGKPGRTGAPVVGYIGESERDPEIRRKEHELDKWWAPDIIAFFVVKDEVTGEDKTWPNKAAVWAEERRLVELYLPPYNLEYNGSNKWLIKDGRGVHQDLPPQPAWWPTPEELAAKRPAPATIRPLGADVRRHPEAKPTDSSVRTRTWRRTFKRWMWQGAGLAAVALAVWIWLAVTHQAQTPKDGAGMGVFVAGALGFAVHWVRGKVRRRKR